MRPLSRVLGTGLALVLALSAAGCGNDSGSTSAPAGATRTVVDVEGTSMRVPLTPRRVVALSEPTLDGALALGVTPVGTITGRGQSTVPSYIADLAGDIPILGSVAQPNYQAIAAAKPDLILVDGTSINNNPDVISILRKIAPTFYAGYAGGDWRPTFDFVAEALGRTKQARGVVSDYEAKVAAARRKLSPYAQSTFSIVRWQGGSASLVLKELPAGIALTDLGLKRPPPQDRRGRGHSEPVSLENLSAIDADYLFFGTLGGSSVGNPEAGGQSDVRAAEKALASAEKVPGFSQLSAHQQDHVIPVEGSLWTSTGGPVLMSRLVDSVQEALA